MKLQGKFVRLPFVLFSFLALVGFFVLAEPSGARVSSETVGIGAKIDNFTLADTEGKQRSFNDLKGKNGALIVFMSAQCPVVKAYAERINALAKDYQAKGVTVIGMNSNATESLDYVKSNIAERGYSFPMLIDKGNVYADKLGAEFTPQVYLFDKEGKLVYRGAIDNDRSGENITARPLQDAVDATIAGKAVAKTETKAFGCTIKRASK